MNDAVNAGPLEVSELVVDADMPLSETTQGPGPAGNADGKRFVYR